MSNRPRAIARTVVGFVVGASMVARAAELVPEVMVDVGPVSRSSWGSYPGHVGHPCVRRSFSLDSGTEGFNLLYSCCPDKSHAPEVATPEGYIGMPGPSSANWYHNGFVRWVVNGTDIGRTPLASLRRGEAGKRGSVQLVWDRADVVVRATFLMLQGDRTLYLEAAAFPKKPLKSFEAAFTAYPVAYTSNGDRWVITPTRGIQQTRDQAIDPKTETWLLVQDHTLSGKGNGGCGLAFSPDQIAKARVAVHAYPVHVELEAKPGTRRMRFAIWDFHDKTDAEARAYVAAVATRTHQRLDTLDFANPQLDPAFWAKRRKELADMLQRVKGQPKLTARIRTSMAAIDAMHATIAREKSKGQPPPVAAEEKLLDELEKMANAYWDLRLAALFADD